MSDTGRGNKREPTEADVLELLSRAEDDRTLNALVKLARKGVLQVGWDEEAEEFTWRLTELGVRLCETDEIEDFIRAAERPGLGDPTDITDRFVADR